MKGQRFCSAVGSFTTNGRLPVVLPIQKNCSDPAITKMKSRIGVLTSGGDCPGLNAVLRGVVLAAEKLGWEVVGFRDGFEGLLPPGNHVVLGRESIDGIMALGGTIIGTTNRGHFVAKVGAGDRTVVPAQVIADAKKILNELRVKTLIVRVG